MKILIGVLIFLLGNIALSADFNYVDPGDRYYINRFGSNNDEIIVVRKLDYPNVKVRDVDSGESKIVEASTLLTKSQLENEELGNAVLGGVAALAMIACLANPEECKENSQNTNNLYSGGGSTVKKGFPISVKNKCNEDIRMAIRYQTLSKKWKTEYWWNIEPYENTYLSSNGKKILTNNSVLYFHAYSDTGKWKGEDTFQYINKKSYGMKKITDKDGETNIVLSCSDN